MTCVSSTSFPQSQWYLVCLWLYIIVCSLLVEPSKPSERVVCSKQIKSMEVFGRLLSMQTLCKGSLEVTNWDTRADTPHTSLSYIHVSKWAKLAWWNQGYYHVVDVKRNTKTLNLCRCSDSWGEDTYLKSAWSNCYGESTHLAAMHGWHG